MLWRLLGDDNLRRQTPYAPRSREEGHIGVALETLPLPASTSSAGCARSSTRSKSHETTDAARGLDITTYMTAELRARHGVALVHRRRAAGAVARSRTTCCCTSRATRAPGYGTLLSRATSSTTRASAQRARPTARPRTGGTKARTSARSTATARSSRTACTRRGCARRSSYKLTVRLLGVGARVRGLVRLAARRRPTRGHRSSSRRARPSSSPRATRTSRSSRWSRRTWARTRRSSCSRDGEQLTLDIYNYRGPPKTFWEHRSQAGPFYKGNVRNAASSRSRSASDYAAVDAFAAHIAAATRRRQRRTTTDVREIAYASDGGSVAMRYSLVGHGADRDAASTAAVCARRWPRAGATDGSGPQFVASRATR